MSFNSYEFILLLLPISLICYYSATRLIGKSAGKVVLFLTSIIFYARYDLRCLGILLSVTLLNYVFSILLHRDQNKFTLACGILLNVLTLSFFKYFSILSNSISAALSTGLDLQILFPLGISFFTFQQIAYLTDIFRQEVPICSFTDYMLFATYFPKIAQGPIIYHNEFLPQLQQLPTRPCGDSFAKGLYSFAIGLGKKVLLAELLGKIVDYGHGSIASLNSLEAILVILAYTFQLYFDFSGYCDMAVGISQLFGIHLPQNFNSPYKALSIDDFWKRWHITLTRFLTKYIYIPLGGNRKGTIRTYLNILIVFIISGIWHGVGLSFLFWGLLHGVAQMLSRIFKKAYSYIPKAVQWFCTFIFVNIAWVYFRSTTLGNAHKLFSRIFSGGFSINAELAESLRQNTFISALAQFIPMSYILIGLISLCFGIVLCSPNTAALTQKFRPNIKTLIFTLLILLLSILSLSGVGGFLYTNF